MTSDQDNAMDEVMRLREQGDQAMKIGQFEKAIDLYSQASEKNSGYQLPVKRRGDAKFELGRYDEALQDYRRVLAFHPESSHTLVAAGTTLYMMGLAEASLTYFDKAIELNPVIPAFVNRAEALVDLGRYEAAVADYDAALAKESYNGGLYRARGFAKSAMGNHEEALADFEQALRYNQKDATAWYYQGCELLELERHKEAAQAFSKVLKMAPDYANAIVNRGRCKLAQGDAEGALADFDKGVELLPNASWTRANRAEALEALGRDAAEDRAEAERLRAKEEAAAAEAAKLAEARKQAWADKKAEEKRKREEAERERAEKKAEAEKRKAEAEAAKHAMETGGKPDPSILDTVDMSEAVDELDPTLAHEEGNVGAAGVPDSAAALPRPGTKAFANADTEELPSVADLEDDVAEETDAGDADEGDGSGDPHEADTVDMPDVPGEFLDDDPGDDPAEEAVDGTKDA